MNLRTIVLIGALTLALPANAEGEYDKFKEPFRIYVGGFWPQINSEVGINGDDMVPLPPIDVEDVLGVEDGKGVAWGGIAWQFAERHSLQFEYFALNRTGGTSTTFSPPIRLGDTYIEGGSITTSYDTSLTRLTYGFSLTRSERTDLQLKAGLHLATIETGIQLAGLICDPSTDPLMPPGCPAAGSSVVSEDVTAPLPHIGLSYTYLMTPSLAINLQAMGFAFDIDSIDGSILEFNADIAWQPWDHFGFGAGFRYLKTEVDSTNPDLNGTFKFEYLGPTLYVHAVF